FHRAQPAVPRSHHAAPAQGGPGRTPSALRRRRAWHARRSLHGAGGQCGEGRAARAQVGSGAVAGEAHRPAIRCVRDGRVGHGEERMSARGAPRWITTGLSLRAGQGLQAAAPESTSRGDSPLSEVQITATRVAEPIERLPATVTVVGGDSLRDRGAGDLRTALALVAGVDAPPGGDAGPASSVPSLWGLHEFDAFLLVVDGVPAGGAFNPALPTLDLHDV